MARQDWIEVDILEETYDAEGFCFGKRVGRVYERKCYAYQLPTLARERVLKHAFVTPGRTYIAVVSGIGEVARATNTW